MHRTTENRCDHDILYDGSDERFLVDYCGLRNPLATKEQLVNLQQREIRLLIFASN